MQRSVARSRRLCSFRSRDRSAGLAEPVREIARLARFEAIVGAIPDDAAPVLVFLAELAIRHRFEQGLAPGTVFAQRVDDVVGDFGTRLDAIE